ncbi:MAG TPA: ABC transporter permease [Candidatus Eisenbacteria bacterium]|jgi:ABC-type lipoprotein release transport system permease subunit|nr:ABC transporter permease [Candidatus Eisenbacteria bacterium]
MARIPLVYSVRNLMVRRTSTTLTALGIGAVAWVFIFTLALAGGFEAALRTTGSPKNAIVVRSGAASELMSIVSREGASTITSQPEVARATDGSPFAASELVVIWNLERKSGTATNVIVRGVSPHSLALRERARLKAGRMFRPGLNEIVVGARVAERFKNCGLGDKIRLAGREWDVVGIVDAGGTAYDSEVWGDVELFMPVFDRPVFQNVTLRLDDPTHFDALKKRLEKDPRYSLQVRREDEFYASQSGMMAALLRTLGTFVTLIMALGAVFGALNTMYASVAARTKEIGTLLALGFSRGAVMTSVLVESVALCLVGGAVGCLLALPVRSFTTGTMSFATFSELAFRFDVTPMMMAWGLIFAALMGLVGGFFPARRAAMMPITEAVRQA